MCCLSIQRLFCLGEAFFFQNIHYCLAIIALNDDFAVFYRATDTTTLFQEAAQSVEFVVGSDEASDVVTVFPPRPALSILTRIFCLFFGTSGTTS